MGLYDVLCVGDAATDVFIRLSDAHIRIWEDGHGHWMDLPFGGKVPFEYALTVEAGGNAANAAVGLSRLGVPTGIAAHVGSDDIGRTMQAALEREGVDTHLVRFDPRQPSNRNFVLWFGQDRTILVRHELYDYHWPHLSPREVPRWVYLSSVGCDAAAYYEQLVGWLRSEPSVGRGPDTTARGSAGTRPTRTPPRARPSPPPCSGPARAGTRGCRPVRRGRRRRSRPPPRGCR